MKTKTALTPPTTLDLMRLVRGHLARYASHPEFDDILAEGYAGAWASVEKTSRHRSSCWTHAACQGALWAAQSYLRDRSLHRTHTRYGTRFPEFTSLESFPEDQCDQLPRADDPAPGIVAKLHARQLWRRLLATLSERDRAILTARIWEGLSPDEAAQKLGIPRSTLQLRLHRALAAFRLRLEPQE